LIPAGYLIVYSCSKRTKINEKEAAVGPFKNYRRIQIV